MEKINLTGLDEEDMKLLKKLVDFLQAKARAKKGGATAGPEISYRSWPLGVKGRITREEIYDFL